MNKKIEAYIQQSVKNVLGAKFSATQVILAHPVEETHGDYACTIAMAVYPSLTPEQKVQFRSPRELAIAIVTELRKQVRLDLVSSFEVAGPGFINITFAPRWLVDQAVNVVQAGGFELDLPQWHGKKILVEYTDPNPFKELHIGHAYQNILGQAVSQLYRTAGVDVKEVCYQGDVGMHVAKSLWGMQKLFSEENTSLAELAEQSLPARIAFLGRAYATGATAYEEDEAAKTEMQQINFITFVSAQERLQEEEGWQPQVNYADAVKDTQLDVDTIKELYRTGRQWSLEYFETQYERLGMSLKPTGHHFDHYFFESVTGEYGYQAVQAHVADGVFEKSDGAIIFPGKKHGLHDRVFINSLGFPTYEAKDLGLALAKEKQYEFDNTFIMVGNEIIEYFGVVKKALSLIEPERAAKIHNIFNGMVRLPDGKMSSRTGKIIRAADVIDEAEVRVAELAKDSEAVAANKTIALAAIKFAFLKQAIGKDIAFSFDESLSFQGKSGPYVLYTRVRCLSLLEKAGVTQQLVQEQLSSFDVSAVAADLAPAELALLRWLYRLPEVFAHAVEEQAPHHVALFAYELAQRFSVFYDTVPVLKEQNEQKKQWRFALVQATAAVLTQALHVLAIPTVDKM